MCQMPPTPKGNRHSPGNHKPHWWKSRRGVMPTRMQGVEAVTRATTRDRRRARTGRDPEVQLGASGQPPERWRAHRQTPHPGGQGPGTRSKTQEGCGRNGLSRHRPALREERYTLGGTPLFPGEGRKRSGRPYNTHRRTGTRPWTTEVPKGTASTGPSPARQRPAAGGPLLRNPEQRRAMEASARTRACSPEYKRVPPAQRYNPHPSAGTLEDGARRLTMGTRRSTRTSYLRLMPTLMLALALMTASAGLAPKGY